MGCDTFGIDMNVGFQENYVFNEWDVIYLLLRNNINLGGGNSLPISTF